MPPYLGDFDDNQTVHFMWSTNDKNGKSVTRATNGTVSVYKDNGLTQTVVGVTDTEDFDALVGIHVCTIITTDSFYANGSNFTVVLSGATIDGETAIAAPLAHFSILNRPGLRPGVTGRTLDVTATGTAGVDFANISGTLDAANIGSAAITSAKFASGAIDAAAIGFQAITDVKINTGALTAAKFAANAIDAAALATDAVNEIRDSILSDATTFAGANINATIASRATPANVNTEVLDVLQTDTFSQPGQELPAATQSFLKMIQFLYKAWRNKTDQTATDIQLYNDDASTVDQQTTVSDDATTFVRNEMASGP